jgi:hypothetical protein
MLDATFPLWLKRTLSYPLVTLIGSSKVGSCMEVIKLPEVDPYYTYSNDYYEISSILGIEATRTLLIMELKC